MEYYIPRRHRGRGISLVVPFRADTPDRQLIWDWLKKFYEYHLPAAQIVVGTDDGVPFSKTSAWNDAAARATGDVWVLLDSDCWASADSILESARRIRRDRELGRKSWIIPYRRALRLTPDATTVALRLRRPEWDWIEPHSWECQEGWGACYAPNINAHHYMALISVIPVEAFLAIGGKFDERFASWGGEDVSTSWALDTMWGRYRTLDRTVASFDHVMLGENYHRMWAGGKPDQNWKLAARYRAAMGDLDKMRALIKEHL